LGADGLVVDELSTYDWLRRVGLETHAAALEDEGYAQARSLHQLDESKMKEIGVKDKHELAVLKALVTADAEQPRVLLSFTAPDRARIRRDFILAFANDVGRVSEELSTLAEGFATDVCDRAGAGRISLSMLERHLAKWKDAGATACREAAPRELIDHMRPPRSPPPEVKEPSEWIYGWLKEHGLKQHADAFVGQQLNTREDLKMEPRLTLDDLKEIGVSKAGEQRKLMALIKKL